MSDIIWKGSPNHYVGRNGYGVTHITLHIMVGYLAGTDATFANQSSRASAHYGIGATGEIHQYVSELDGSYSDANYASNNSTISIEHEGGMSNGAVCTQACIDASARLCADIALRYGWTKLWHDGLKGNVWLHREIPGTDHLACPDLAPNGLPYKQIIDKANQILEGGSMSNAGDEVWNWAYKPNGKNATPGGNMYNLLAYELPQRVRDSIMQYSYKGSAPGGKHLQHNLLRDPRNAETAHQNHRDAAAADQRTVRKNQQAGRDHEMTDTTENRLPTANTTEYDAMPVSAQIMAATDDDAEASTPRIDGGTISRFLVLLLALVNQALTMFGHPVLNIDDTTITQLVSLAWTAGSAIWCYWKDNDVTTKARVKKARLSARHAA